MGIGVNSMFPNNSNDKRSTNSSGIKRLGNDDSRTTTVHNNNNNPVATCGKMLAKRSNSNTLVRRTSACGNSSNSLAATSSKATASTGKRNTNILESSASGYVTVLEIGANSDTNNTTIHANSSAAVISNANSTANLAVQQKRSPRKSNPPSRTPSFNR